MRDAASARPTPFVTTEQRDIAELTAKLIADELEARLGPKLDAIVTGLAVLVELAGEPPRDAPD